MDALEIWLRAEVAQHSDLDHLHDRMLDLNPQLRAVTNARLTEVIQQGARILAEERGDDPDDFGPRMAAAAAAAVISEVGHHTPIAACASRLASRARRSRPRHCSRWGSG